MPGIVVSDVALAKILRTVKNNSSITMNELIYELDFSSAYLSYGLSELKNMGCVVSDRTGGRPNKAFYNVTNHGCFYCKGT